MQCDLCDKEASVLTSWRMNDKAENTIMICGKCRARFAKKWYGIKKKKEPANEVPGKAV